jgi:hypothetical protein
MTATCIALSLTEDQRMQLGATPQLQSVYQLSVGKEYTILGVLFVVQSSIFGSEPLFDIQDDMGFCNSVPACLFEVADARPSRYWRAKRVGSFDLALWPEEFYQEFFHDHLSNGMPDEVEIFKDLTQRLKSEF